MNLTATMAKNPTAFLDMARNDAHARHAAILACGSREDLYFEARALGMTDQQIIANANAEAHEEFDGEAWGNGDLEIDQDALHDTSTLDPELVKRLSDDSVKFGINEEDTAIIARLEENDCE